MTWTRNKEIGITAGRAIFVLAVTAFVTVIPARSDGQTQTVTAAWNANSDGVTTGYRLYYGTSPTTYSSDINVGNVTSYPLTLAPGTYYFTVRAYNAASQLGPAADQVSFTVGAAPSPPTATLTGSMTGPNTASLAWSTTNATSVTLNGAAVALSGTASYTINAATTYTLLASGAGGSITRAVTLTPVPVDCVLSAWSFQSATPWSDCPGGQQSRVETWVRTIIVPPANGGLACGPLQEQRTVTQACSAPATPPTAPTNLEAQVSGQQATLTWTANSSGGAPSTYLVSVGTSPGASNVFNAVDVGNTLTATSGKLSRGTYYARVKAANGAGVSADSAEISFRIGDKGKPRRPGALTGSFQDAVVTLSWSEPAAADGDGSPTAYVIEAGSAPGLSDVAVVTVSSLTSFQAGAVPPGLYYVRVRAVNELGLGDPSNEIVLSTFPIIGSPLDLAESGDGGLVSLTWEAPRTGDVPAGYLIEAGSSSGLADVAVLRLGHTTSFATMAPPGVYYVRVRGVDAAGRAGEASNEIVVRR